MCFLIAIMSMPGAFDSEPDTDTERATLVERFDVEDSSMDEDFSLSTDDDDASAIYYGEDGEEDEGLAALNEAADAEIERVRRTSLDLHLLTRDRASPRPMPTRRLRKRRRR